MHEILGQTDVFRRCSCFSSSFSNTVCFSDLLSPFVFFLRNYCSHFNLTKIWPATHMVSFCSHLLILAVFLMTIPVSNCSYSVPPACQPNHSLRKRTRGSGRTKSSTGASSVHVQPPQQPCAGLHPEKRGRRRGAGGERSGGGAREGRARARVPAPSAASAARGAPEHPEHPQYHLPSPPRAKASQTPGPMGGAAPARCRALGLTPAERSPRTQRPPWASRRSSRGPGSA